MGDVYISVDKRNVDGWYQMSIDDGSGVGYRLYGPKYDGAGRNIIRYKLTEKDKAEFLALLKSRS
jgi:hypothetical protein